MKFSTAILAAAILGASLPAMGAGGYDESMAEAREAYSAGDWPRVAEAADAAQSHRPYSMSLARNRILARALSGDLDGAVAIVREIANRGVNVELSGHPGFDALRTHPAYAAAAAQMEANSIPKGDEQIVLESPLADLLPESYAADRRGAFIGSVRTGKIVAADGDDFAQAPGGVYGMEISRGRLFAVANTASPFHSPSDPALAGLYAFDRKTGALLSRAEIHDRSSRLGDLEMTPSGMVVSDSETPRLLLEQDGALVEFARDPRFVNLQGLAYDKKRKTLYVADYLAGLFAIDIKTGDVQALTNPADAWLGGIDGLYAYRDGLVAIQNGTSPQRIVRLGLDRNGRAVASLDVVQQALPGWSEPTNGQVVGSELHYVATSNWPAYSEDGTIRDDVARKPLRILSAPLD